MNHNQSFSEIKSNNLIKLPDVEKKTAKKRSSIYAMIAKNKFPRPLKIGERSRAWLENEIDQWIAEKEQGR